MRNKLILAFGFLWLAAAPASAARLKVSGVAVSDGGVFTYVRVTGRLIRNKLRGTYRCTPGTARCLIRRAPIRGVFTRDSAFIGTVRKGRARCSFVGDVLDGVTLVGRYECSTPRAFDRGDFEVE
jgi:hypothetical protein